MAELPIELWHLIFDHLQLADLSSCARVSKAVYVAMKSYRIREIAFTGRVYEWFHHSTPITDHKYRIDYSLASILKRSSFDFDFLKRLKIGRSSAIDDLEEINKFTGLEELDIDLKNYKNEKSRTLSLANLKVLYLFVPGRLSYVELDTPQLEKLYTFSLKMLEFIYPESIQCLHTFVHSGKLSMFRHLEYLAFTDHYNLQDYQSSYDSRGFRDFSVTNLKKLKEIDFFYHSYEFRVKNMSVFKKIIANLLALGRPDLKVFWFHVQMTDSHLLTKYERMDQSVGSLLAFQLKHYDKLKKKAHFFWSYGFNGSMKKLSIAGFRPLLRSEEFLSKLLGKFSFRRIDVLGQVEEREFLLELIARSPDLYYLLFENSGLDQSFFDQMAVRLSDTPLRQLRCKASSSTLNFDFVSGFRDLELFETDQPLSAELISKLLRLPLLTKIEFASAKYKIERMPTGKFYLHGDSLSLQFLTLN